MVGRPATLAITKHNLVVLEQGGRTLTAIFPKQYDYGALRALQRLTPNLLWIDGDETDYTARLQLDAASPSIEEPRTLPFLATKPCSFWARFWGDCWRAQGQVGANLGRVFVTGHRPTLFGISRQETLEVTESGTRPLPGPARWASIRWTDGPGGALLAAPNGDVVWYDGRQAKTFSWNVPGATPRTPSRWSVRRLASGERLILSGQTPDGKGFLLAELRPGPTWVRFSVPEAAERTWWEIVEVPGDARLWVVTRQAVWVEDGPRLVPVARIDADAAFEGPADLATNGGAVLLQVVGRNGVRQRYVLQAGSCAAPLRPGKAVTLPVR